MAESDELVEAPDVAMQRLEAALDRIEQVAALDRAERQDRAEREAELDRRERQNDADRRDLQAQRERFEMETSLARQELEADMDRATAEPNGSALQITAEQIELAARLDGLIVHLRNALAEATS